MIAMQTYLDIYKKLLPALFLLAATVPVFVPSGVADAEATPVAGQEAQGKENAVAESIGTLSTEKDEDKASVSNMTLREIVIMRLEEAHKKGLFKDIKASDIEKLTDEQLAELARYGTMRREVMEDADSMGENMAPSLEGDDWDAGEDKDIETEEDFAQRMDGDDEKTFFQNVKDILHNDYVDLAGTLAVIIGGAGYGYLRLQKKVIEDEGEAMWTYRQKFGESTLSEINKNTSMTEAIKKSYTGLFQRAKGIITKTEIEKTAEMVQEASSKYAEKAAESIENATQEERGRLNALLQDASASEDKATIEDVAKNLREVSKQKAEVPEMTKRDFAKAKEQITATIREAADFEDDRVHQAVAQALGHTEYSGIEGRGSYKQKTEDFDEKNEEMEDEMRNRYGF